MKILFILLFALFVGACQQQNSQSANQKENNGKEAPQTSYVKKNYYDRGEKTKTVWYYESGEVYRVTTFKDNKIDGIRKFYYRNGTLKAEVPYKGGDPVEGLKEYTTSGTLVKGYPSIQFKKTEKFDENQVILRFNLSNNTPNVEYDQVIEVNGREIKKSLPAHQGYSQLQFRLAPGYQIENKKIIIQAKTNSGRGNTYITRGVYNLNAVHPG